jgi:hypothetical protein
MHQMKLHRVKYVDVRIIKQLEIVTSKKAMTWLRQGGFSWRDVHTQDAGVPEKHKIFSEDQEFSNYVSKPRGTRQDRKALAREKGAYPEWTDEGWCME